MLKKLLKYEFRSIGRQLIPLYLGVLGLAVVNHFIWFVSPDSGIWLADGLGGIPAMATMMAYVSVCVALCVITVLLIIQRFYKGLLTEEGYLMFTLPCKTWQLIAAKGLAASVMIVGGSVVGVLSIMLMGMEMSDWGFFFRGFAEIPWGEMFRTHALWPLYIVESLALFLVLLFSSVGHMYVAIAVGHMFHKHRIAWAIAAYIGINIVMGVLMVTGANLLGRLDLRWLNAWGNSLEAPWAIHLAFLFSIVVNLVPAAAYFFGTNWILSNKLNLE